MEFIHMCNSLTLNDVMKHLPCVGLWSSTPFSLARCFELVTSTVLELPMESSSAYPYIEAQSTEKVSIKDKANNFNIEIILY